MIHGKNCQMYLLISEKDSFQFGKKDKRQTNLCLFAVQ